MPWDDELEALAFRVQERFGIEGLNDAVSAAVMAATREGQPSPPGDAVVDILGPGNEGRAAVVSDEIWARALKKAFRRVLVSH